jgi:hypothetical protein
MDIERVEAQLKGLVKELVDLRDEREKAAAEKIEYAAAEERKKREERARRYMEEANSQVEMVINLIYEALAEDKNNIRIICPAVLNQKARSVLRERGFSLEISWFQEATIIDWEHISSKKVQKLELPLIKLEKPE